MIRLYDIFLFTALFIIRTGDNNVIQPLLYAQQIYLESK